MFSYMNYVADLNVSYFGAGANLGDLGSIGLSLNLLILVISLLPHRNFRMVMEATYSPSFITVGLHIQKLLPIVFL